MKGTAMVKKMQITAARRAKVLNMILLAPDEGVPLADIVERFSQEYSKSDINNTLTSLKTAGLVFRRKKANFDRKSSWSKKPADLRIGSPLSTLFREWCLTLDRLNEAYTPTRRKCRKTRKPQPARLVQIIGV